MSTPSPTASELYHDLRELLSSSWEASSQLLPPLPVPALRDTIRTAVESRELSPRYALLTQALLKALFPTCDARQLEVFAGAPGGFSGRSVAKQVIVPFDAGLNAALGGSSGDPYVSQPLRRPRLEDSLRDTSQGERWAAVIDVLDYLNGHPSDTPTVLLHILAELREHILDLHKLLARVLELQAHWRGDETAREARLEVVQHVGPAYLKTLLPDDLDAKGSAGFGTPAEVPWMRVFDPVESPKPKDGWYLAYLFNSDGTGAFLTLIRGTEETPAALVDAEVEAARDALGPMPHLLSSIDLGSIQAGGRPAAYQRATVYALEYARHALPMPAQLESDLNDMIGLMRTLHVALDHDDAGVVDYSKLTNELVAAEVAAAGLQLDANVIATAVASLRAKKHLLLTGPPGTGKTSFAQAIGSAAKKAGLSAGWMSTTATADWTSVDTVGGFWPSQDQQLRFRAGQVLQAIDADEWLLIDELNRADIDKAVGQLFTVLSGHSVVLPFVEERDGVALPPSIVPFGASTPKRTHPHEISDGWRMIATLNTRDRDLLFSLSYALLRRFAIIDLPVPPPKESQAILESAGSTGSADVDGRIVALTSLPHRQIGPAILLDCASYARTRLEIDADAEPPAVVAELLFAFVLPQLDDLTRPQQRDVVKFARQHMLQGWGDAKVSDLFARAFQVSPHEFLPAASLSDTAEESSGDGPEAPLPA